MFVLSNFLFLNYILVQTTVSALLYPQDGPTRDVKSLDGLWKFAKDIEFDPNEKVYYTVSGFLGRNIET